jgi:hypothetical protein
MIVCLWFSFFTTVFNTIFFRFQSTVELVLEIVFVIVEVVLLGLDSAYSLRFSCVSSAVSTAKPQRCGCAAGEGSGSSAAERPGKILAMGLKMSQMGYHRPIDPQNNVLNLLNCVNVSFLKCVKSSILDECGKGNPNNICRFCLDFLWIWTNFGAICRLVVEVAVEDVAVEDVSVLVVLVVALLVVVDVWVTEDWVKVDEEVEVAVKP